MSYNINNNMDYDFDAVMDLCTSKETTGALTSLEQNLKDLVKKLNQCEKDFHCKGGTEANALMDIYDGFSAAIGWSSANYVDDGAGLARINEFARETFQTGYDQAYEDKRALSSMEWFSSQG